MKIKSLIWFFTGSAIVAGGVTAAVLFSDVNTNIYPYVKILTKENYQSIKKAQNNTQSVNVDYWSLPSTSYNLLDVALGSSKINNSNFMVYVGSEAYTNTTSALYGWTSDFAANQGFNMQYSNSLMLRLYDLFLTDNEDAVQYGVQNINPYFLNYIDLCNTEEVIKADRLLAQRRLMGDFYTADGETDSSEYVPGTSKYWKIGDDIADAVYEPVVKGGERFDYTPSNNSYEFRPNNHVDTEYEKVFFRDQEEVNDYLNNINFLNNYFSTNYGSTAINKEGTLIAFRNTEKHGWAHQVFNVGGTGEQNVIRTFNDVVRFYNPDLKEDDLGNSTTRSLSSTQISQYTEAVEIAATPRFNIHDEQINDSVTYHEIILNKEN